MEAAAGLDILGDLFVAIETKLLLRLAVEAHMASIALVLDLGMARRERARHDETLERAELCHRSRGHEPARQYARGTQLPPSIAIPHLPVPVPWVRSQYM